MLKIISIISFAILFPSGLNAKTFLCKADKITGFFLNEKTKRWEITSFSSHGNTWLVRPPTNREIQYYSKAYSKKSLAYVVHRSGDENEYERALCEEKENGYGLVFCKMTIPYGRNFNFNVNTGKYIRANDTGFVEAEILGAEGGQTPHIEIGFCSEVK
jgi:hypothetical protein